MRIVTIIHATLAGLVSVGLPPISAWASPPNMTCTAIGSVASGSTATDRIQTISRSTDVFRLQGGKLYHRVSGRAETLYNDVSEVGSGRYASGHMLFVMAEPDNRLGRDRKGYVVIAEQKDWRVVYVDCKT